MGRKPAYTYKIDDIESLVKSGNASLARKSIYDLVKRSKLDSSSLVRVANLSRRAGMVMFSLRLIRPLIFEQQQIKSKVDSYHVSSYAAGLIAIGALDEGLALLHNQDGDRNPDVYFFQSLALFQNWNYRKSIPLLKKFIQHSQITPYQKLVGKVNLISAYLSLGQFDLADDLIHETLNEVLVPGYDLLLGNLLELKAQSLFLQKKYHLADLFLKESVDRLKQSSGFYLVYAKKWQILTELYLQNTSPIDVKNKIAEVKKMAFDRRNWETLRDLDLHEGLITKDAQKLNQVYFGSPLPSFRSRLRQIFPDDFQLQEKFILTNSGNQNLNSSTRILDVLAVEENIDFKIKPSMLVGKSLQTILQDWYRPVRVGTYFASLFPNQYFDPNTSMDRLSKVNRRLRYWLSANQIPLQITQSQNMFTAKLTEENYQLLFRKNNKVMNALQLDILKLQRKFGTRPFTNQQAAQLLNISDRQQRRRIKQAIEAGQIHVIGHGSERKYKVA